MSHRVDHWHEALVEHLTNREWSQSQIEALSHDIGRSALMSSEGVLRVLEVQQQVDEQIAAEKEHDRWAIGQEFGEFTPEQFKATERYQMCEDGEFPEIPPVGWGGGLGKPVIPETFFEDTSPFVSDHVQRRFEETL